MGRRVVGWVNQRARAGQWMEPLCFPVPARYRRSAAFPSPRTICVALRSRPREPSACPRTRVDDALGLLALVEDLAVAAVQVQDVVHDKELAATPGTVCGVVIARARASERETSDGGWLARRQTWWRVRGPRLGAVFGQDGLDPLHLGEIKEPQVVVVPRLPQRVVKA